MLMWPFGPLLECLEAVELRCAEAGGDVQRFEAALAQALTSEIQMAVAINWRSYLWV